MKRLPLLSVFFGIAQPLLYGPTIMAENLATQIKPGQTISLPKPSNAGKISVEEALKKRRSIREYRNKPLTLTETAQLLWAAQGITSADGLRTAPSAGALYPLEVYLLAGNVNELPPGLYKYSYRKHKVELLTSEDRRTQLSKAAFDQMWMKDAPVIIVLAAEYERVTRKYEERGIRYVHMEVGHAVENIYLQATALQLGTAVVGAFTDAQVKHIVQLEGRERPLAIMPVGRPR